MDYLIKPEKKDRGKRKHRPERVCKFERMFPRNALINSPSYSHSVNCFAVAVTKACSISVDKMDTIVYHIVRR